MDEKLVIQCGVNKQSGCHENILIKIVKKKSRNKPNMKKTVTFY